MVICCPNAKAASDGKSTKLEMNFNGIVLSSCNAVNNTENRKFHEELHIRTCRHSDALQIVEDGSHTIPYVQQI